MNLNKLRNIDLFIIGCLILSISFMFLAAIKQPLWLDEQYSLFFARAYAIPQLLFHFTVDSHPGLYYVYLKSLLLFSHNLVVLRILSSVLPATLGLVSIWWLSTVDQTKKLIWQLTPFFFLNPFIINMTWQLRMYGLVIMLSCFFYVLFARWKTDHQTFSLLLLSGLLILSVWIHYGFILIASAVTALLIFDGQSSKSQRTISLFTTCAVFMIVSLSSGLATKQKLAHVAWVTQPTIAAISSTYLTLLGIRGDYFGTHIVPSALDIGVVIILFLCLAKIVHFLISSTSSFKKNQALVNLLTLGIIPIGVILVASWILPFLSHQPFFYHFIPNASLFIPRVHLPFLILGGLYVLENIKNKYFTKYLIAFCAALATIWILNNMQFNIFRNHVSPSERQELEVILNNQSQVFLIPSWLWVEKVTPTELSSISNLNYQIIKSEQLEARLTSEAEFCSLVRNQTVVMKKFISQSLNDETALTKKKLSECCREMVESSSFEQWHCSQ
jgi:hypothetical protein